MACSAGIAAIALTVPSFGNYDAATARTSPSLQRARQPGVTSSGKSG